MKNTKTCSECAHNKSCLNLYSVRHSLSQAEMSEDTRDYIGKVCEKALGLTCKEYIFDVNIARGIFGVQELFPDENFKMKKE